MKKTLIKTVSCCSLIVAALTLTSWAADNVMTKEDGMTVINTTTLGKSVEGYIMRLQSTLHLLRRLCWTSGMARR